MSTGPFLHNLRGLRAGVAVSGGLDSLGALLILKKLGARVTAYHALLTPGARVPENLPEVCDRLGAPLKILDLRAEFEQDIITGFARAHTLGLTPNPCACCNQKIKFGRLLDAALNGGADFFATGHYCRLTPHAATGAPLLAPARDRCKDQAYFLGLVDVARFNKVIFPLARARKSGIRRLLAASGLAAPVAAESQDTCFLEGASVADFLAARQLNGRKGAILLRAEEDAGRPLEALPRIGEHGGLASRTIGQRRGLGASWREPLYVREKHVAANCVVAAPISLMGMAACETAGFNFHLPWAWWPRTLFARTRYSRKAEPCAAQVREGGLRIVWRKPQFASAPGQLAAIYDASGFLLGAGMIGKVDFAD